MRWWCGVVGATLVLGAISGAAAAPPGEPLAYGVFASEQVRLGARVQVTGDVGANDEVRIGPRSSIDGVVAAPTIRVGRKATSGERVCVLVIGGKEDCLPLTSPVVSPGSLGVGLVAPGSEDVTVPRRGRRAPHDAGAYGQLRIGRGSELVLTGGDYLFERIRLARGASLRCAAPCRLSVRRTVRMGRRASIEAASQALEDAVRVDVTGQRARTAVRLGPHAALHGILWAPVGRVRLGGHATIGRSVVAAELRVGARARIGTDVGGPE